MDRNKTSFGPVRGRLERAVDSHWRFLIALIANAPTVLLYGWHDPVLDEAVLSWTQWGVVVVYAVVMVLSATAGLKGREDRKQFLKITRPEQVLAVMGVAFFWWGPGEAVAAGLLLMVHVVRLYLRLTQSRVPPGLVFVGSFVALIGVGTLALKLPAATPADQPIGLLDAAFTITSAISQTGLVVRPTGEGFTRFGQVIILVWIQVGALGVIVFGALLATVIGRSFGLRATQTIAEGTEQGWAGQLSLQRLVTFIILITHGVEAIGAAVFYFGWPEQWEGMPSDMVTSGDRLFHAIFFSVSSFCNAGFSTTSDSMASLRTHWTAHGLIVPLIIFGSIGFPVLDNIREVVWARIRGIRMRHGSLVRLNLNSKIILTTTGTAYILGFLIILVGEMTQADVPFRLAVLDAHFMNINRTSGFNTIEVADMGLLSRLGLIFLMFLGGSPGSVAGGIKMMVFAVLALTVWSTLRGRAETTAFGRTLPDALVRKCAALIVLALLVCMATTGVLAATEQTGSDMTLGPLLFEAVSAFGTTGLSMGITPDLSPAGKGAIMFAMFVGRVGIFAVLAALLSMGVSRRASYHYPTEDVVVY